MLCTKKIGIRKASTAKNKVKEGWSEKKNYGKQLWTTKSLRLNQVGAYFERVFLCSLLKITSWAGIGWPRWCSAGLPSWQVAKNKQTRPANEICWFRWFLIHFFVWACTCVYSNMTKQICKVSPPIEVLKESFITSDSAHINTDGINLWLIRNLLCINPPSPPSLSSNSIRLI